jgi:predicted methyltransferase
MERKPRRLDWPTDGSTEFYADSQFIYMRKGGETFKLALFDNGFYRLRLNNGIPMLEIDGLRMHLIRDFKTPLDYSKAVVRELGVARGDSVLDTCMGLGYTAIEASHSAGSVVTCEISRAVRTLAEWNPWSAELFRGGKITVVEGDIALEIAETPSSSFDVIIHDPPSFARAGGLYSLEFYRELYRALRPQGRLFHYVGSVGKGRRRKIEAEVTKRLALAGFRNIRYKKNLQGLLAVK